MSDLHEDLNTALGAVEPGAAPVEAAMLAGRKIRNRRRAGLLAGAVAVVAAVAVGVPALSRPEALPQPATDHVRVTVNPPGPHSPAGLIASGLIGSQPWDVVVQSPSSSNCEVTGINLAVACEGGLTQPDAADPIALDGSGGGTGNALQYFVSYGAVRADVASVRVVLSDGTVLNPRPTMIDGRRLVAFATPAGVPVDSLTVYSRTGEIATAIPFNGPVGDSQPSFSQWLRPGQAVPGRLSGTIGSGTANGQAWRATAYLGPWGTCVVIGGDSYCFDPAKHPQTGAVGFSPSYEWGTAADSVSYLMVTPKGGTTPMRVNVIAVGPEKFWATKLSKNEQMGGHFTAYDAAGKLVASGSLLG